MVRVDTRLLAKYGILQSTRRGGPLAMTIMHPVASLSKDERLDLMDFAQMMVEEHENGYPALEEALKALDGVGVGGDDNNDRHDDEDEGVLHDEA
ncbi:MAG: hypothetical protein IT342_12815 [Candidatus Melainabacteria bacterium]|nr:hypothetical protein [Candidatus Melainabacteria bacterium]